MLRHDQTIRILELNTHKSVGEIVCAHEIIRETSPHWPGIGNYVGTIDDEKPILMQTGSDFSCFDYYDRQPWQKNRVYGDEISLATNRINFVSNLKYAQEQ